MKIARHLHAAAYAADDAPMVVFWRDDVYRYRLPTSRPISDSPIKAAALTIAAWGTP
jgi:hypothetical protein